MVAKCPSCGTHNLQQQQNPVWFNCLACGVEFILYAYIPESTKATTVKKVGSP